MMDGYKIDPTDVDQVVDMIAAVDGLDARTDPTDALPTGKPTQVGYIGTPVELPGVVLQVYGYTFDTLDAYSLRGRLLLIVPDQPARDAIGALADLLNRVTSVVRPAGEVTHEAVALPDRGAPLPALSVPIAVRCTPASEEEA
jgi:hypothetical protein